MRTAAQPTTRDTSGRSAATAADGESESGAPIRESILRAASAVMQTYGYEKLTVRDVATAARVSRGTVYNYFADRDTLVDAVFEFQTKAFLDQIRPIMESRKSLQDRLAEFAVLVVHNAQDERRRHVLPPETHALMLTVRSGPLLIRASTFLSAYLDQAKSDGEVRKRLDSGRAAEWIVRMFFSLASLPSYQVDLDDPADVRAFVKEFVLRGLL